MENAEAQLRLPLGDAPSTCDVNQAPPLEECSTCGVVLERIDDCPQCGTGMDKPSGETPNTEKSLFKPYANISSSIESNLDKILSHAFSGLDPRERPWCGLGLEVGLLAVSPTELTVADVKEVSGVKQAIVRVPQNWREPWYVDAADGTRQQLSDNPCDRAESSIAILKRSLDCLASADDQPASRRVKYLIIFPDGYSFEGPKEYFIVERREVLTLQLRNLRDLPAAILATTQKQRLDSRKYRSWIEGTILKKTDDSILGTWLDPAFDQVESEPPKKERWWFHLRYKRMPSEQQEVASADSVPPMTPIRKTLEPRQVKLLGVVVTGMVLGIVGWRLSDANKLLTSISQSNPSMSPSRPENSVNAPDAGEDASAGIAKQDPVAVTEVRESGEPREFELKRHDKNLERTSKPAEQSQPREDSDRKRRRLELEIDKAIRRRAIAGVTVDFVGDTARLKGRVATENQKAAAEQAARGVPGVKNVRSFIAIDFLASEDG